MRRVALIGMVVLLAACSTDDQDQTVRGSTSAPTLVGVVTLEPDEDISLVGLYYRSLTECDGAASLTGQDGRTRTFFGPPASNIKSGTPVSVADDKGQIIGVGQVQSGRWVEFPTSTNLTQHKCEMPFSVTLSRSSPFYAIEVGTEPPRRFAADAPIRLTFEGRGTLSG